MTIDDYVRNQYARATFWGFVLLVIVVAITIRAAMGVTVEPNSTYVFNYTDQDNATQSVDFFCPLNATSCVDRFLNVTLDPGESQTDTDGQCHLNATCSACPSNTTDKCVIDLTAKEGKQYTYTRGACDVRIEVPEYNNTDCSDVETVTQYIDYSIDRNDDGFTIRIDNRSVYVPAGNLSEFSFNGQQAITCPEHIAITSQAEADQAAALCGKLAPLLINDWIHPSLVSCRNLSDAYINDMKNGDAKVAECQSNLAQANADKSALTAQVESCESIRSTTQKQYEDEQSTSSIYLVLGIMALVYALVTSAIAGVMAYHIYKGRTA